MSNIITNNKFGSFMESLHNKTISNSTYIMCGIQSYQIKFALSVVSKLINRYFESSMIFK